MSVEYPVNIPIEVESRAPTPPIQLPEETRHTPSPTSSTVTDLNPPPHAAPSAQPPQVSEPTHLQGPATTRIQTLAKFLLLAHLPAHLSLSVMTALVHERHRVLKADTTVDEVLAIAAAQLTAVTARCRQGFAWIDHELPEWVEIGRERVVRLREIPELVSGRVVNEDDGGESDEEEEEEEVIEIRRRPRRREGRLGVRKLIFAGLTLLAFNWLCSFQFAFLRWLMRPQIPIWMIIAAVWWRRGSNRFQGRRSAGVREMSRRRRAERVKRRNE